MLNKPKGLQREVKVKKKKKKKSTKQLGGIKKEINKQKNKNFSRKHIAEKYKSSKNF